LHFNPVIQKIRITDAETADYAACPFIRCTVNQASHSSLDEGAGAHRARLDRRVNIDSGEPVVAEFTGGFAEGDDFRMGCGITIGASAIAGDGERIVFAGYVYYARADGHFAACLGFASRGQRLPHPALIKLDFRSGIHWFGFLHRAFKQPNGHYRVRAETRQADESVLLSVVCYYQFPGVPRSNPARALQRFHIR
jgi:hypothetical protein